MEWEWRLDCLLFQHGCPEALACGSLFGKYLNVVAWYPGSETGGSEEVLGRREPRAHCTPTQRGLLSELTSDQEEGKD